jgi:hypothetical protein
LVVAGQVLEAEAVSMQLLLVLPVLLYTELRVLLLLVMLAQLLALLIAVLQVNQCVRQQPISLQRAQTELEKQR